MNIIQDLSKKKMATINPYRSAVELILFRMLWDIHPYSWISRKRIRGWKEKYSGKKAVILCNGPSLNKVDFKCLKESGIFSIGLNKINLLFKKTDFRPSIIVAVNQYIIRQNADFYNVAEMPLFLDCQSKKWVKFRKNIHFLHSSIGNGNFARDCSISICQGHTVTYVAMQLSFHMGFNEVALIGCDHYFSTKGFANELVNAKKKDFDHFDLEYFSGDQKWQLPDLSKSELYYKIARDNFERYGKKIINCTEGGKLELFERKSFKEFLGK